MKYAVEVTDTAWTEIEEAFYWLEERAPLAAQRWKQRLLESNLDLERSPGRCAIAPEGEYFRREIRQLLVGKRQHKYRVLFEIQGKTVVVLRVRHGARRLLDE